MQTLKVMDVSFPFSATPFELLKAYSLSGTGDSDERKFEKEESCHFLFVHCRSGLHCVSSLYSHSVPSLRFLCPLTFSTLFKSLPGTNGNGQKLHWLILLISCSVASSGDLKLREVTSHGTITQLAGGRAVLAPGSDSAELPSGQCGLCYFLVTQKVSFNVAAALPLLRRSWRRLFFYSFCSEVTKNNNPR